MNIIEVKIPYQIGTYLIREENNIKHIDQIQEYIISKDGIYSVLTLDIFENPKFSERITIEELINNWKNFDASKQENIERVFYENIMHNISLLLNNVPNINDVYTYRGCISDIYKKILEQKGCQVQREDFGIEKTIIKRVKLIDDANNTMENENLIKKIK